MGTFQYSNTQNTTKLHRPYYSPTSKEDSLNNLTEGFNFLMWHNGKIDETTIS